MTGTEKYMKMWLAFSMSLAVGFFASWPAFAAVGSGAVDFTGFAVSVIDVAALGLTAAAGILTRFAISWFSSKTKFNDAQMEALLAARVNDILTHSINYAEAWAKAQVSDPNSPLREVRIDNFFIRVAVDYALASMPDLIKTFGLTTTRLDQMIRSRLNVYIAPPVPDQKLELITSPAPQIVEVPAV